LIPPLQIESSEPLLSRPAGYTNIALDTQTECVEIYHIWRDPDKENLGEFQFKLLVPCDPAKSTKNGT
jgi:hypothetical protein